MNTERLNRISAGIDAKDVRASWDPELRQAQKDWADYLESRDSIDKNGNVHDAKTGRFKTVGMTDSADAYYDVIAQNTLGETSRNQLSLVDLAYAAKEAYGRGDKTMASDIEDDIQDKLAHYQEEHNWSEEALTAKLNDILDIIHEVKKEDMVDQAASVVKGVNDTLDNPKISVSDRQNVLKEVQDIIRNIDNKGQDPQEIVQQLDQYLKDKHSNVLKELNHSREAFLKIMAKSQNGHLLRIGPDSFVANALRQWPMFAAVGGYKLANFLTRPNRKERQAGRMYEDRLKSREIIARKFLQQEVENGNLSEEDEKSLLLGRMMSEHRSNLEYIADLQKGSGRPLTKWIRRAGYVAAGVAGGLLSVVNAPLGVAVAVSGASSLRILANKRRGSTKLNEYAAKRLGVNQGQFEHVADAVAEKYQQSAAKRWSSKDEITASDITESHYDQTAEQIGKNVSRLFGPLATAALAGLVTRFGYEVVSGLNGAAMTQGAASSTAESNVSIQSPNIQDTDNNQAALSELSSKADNTGTSAASVSGETFNGTDFMVESGSGYIRELSQFAETNGQQLNSQQAAELHQALVGQFGSDYIDINGAGNDVYGHGSDIRLAESGSAQWSEGVSGFIKQWMTNRGIWK